MRQMHQLIASGQALPGECTLTSGKAVLERSTSAVPFSSIGGHLSLEKKIFDGRVNYRMARLPVCR